MYSIAPATVPEPGYSAVLLISLAGLALRKRVLGAQ
jgi:hypothetical protein